MLVLTNKCIMTSKNNCQMQYVMFLLIIIIDYNQPKSKIGDRLPALKGNNLRGKK